MRTALVLALIVVVAVCSSDAAWGRRFWRRNKGTIIRAAIAYYGKRSVSEIDANQDGVVDQEEIVSLIGTRDAEEFLKFADNNGDNEISLDEYEQAVNSMLHR